MQTESGNRTVLRSGHPPHPFFACGIDRTYIVFAAKEETELRTEFTAVRVLRGPHRETRFVTHEIKCADVGRTPSVARPWKETACRIQRRQNGVTRTR